MYIITDKKSLVMGVTEEVVYAENGDVGIDSTYFFATSIVGEVLEVEALPSDYEEGKYKFVEGEFIAVEGWQPPKDISSNEELQRKLEEQERAIAELSTVVATLVPEVGNLQEVVTSVVNGQTK